MLEPINGEVTGRRRLVLGFDRGCATCSDLACRIEEGVGDKLEVRSLHDPQVEHWRKQALGADAPWAPTLIRVEGERVETWVGWKLGMALMRYLGPARTWKVMGALGKTSLSPHGAKAPLAVEIAGISRSKFLKGVGGATLAASVLASTGGITSSASAADRNTRAAAQAQKMREESEKIRRAVSVMEEHMHIRKDGTLAVEAEGLSRAIRLGTVEGIEHRYFDDLKRDLAVTNREISAGTLKAGDVFPSNEVKLVEAHQPGRNARGRCRGRSGRRRYWWGFRLYLSSCDVNKLLLVYAGYLSLAALCDKFPFTAVPCKYIRAVLTFSAGYVHYVHARGGSDGLVIQKSWYRYLPKLYSQ